MLDRLLDGEDMLTGADVTFVEQALGMNLTEEMDES